MATPSTKLLISATRFEAQILYGQMFPGHNLSPKERDGYLFSHTATPEGPLAFVITGMGAEPGADGLEKALREAGPVEYALGYGFAGALAKTALPGSLVVPDGVHWRDQQVSPTTSLRESLLEFTPGEVVTKLASRETIVGSALEKAALHAALGVEAVDMESGAWGEVLNQQGIPWALVRVILDTAEEEIPSALPLLADGFGRPHLGRMANMAMTQPSVLFTARKFARRAQEISGPSMAGVLSSFLAKSERDALPKERKAGKNISAS